MAEAMPITKRNLAHNYLAHNYLTHDYLTHDLPCYGFEVVQGEE